MPSARRRVLLLVPSFAGGAGGAEHVFSILLRHLDRRLFELHIAVAQGRHSHLKDIPDDVCVHDLHVSRMRYALPRIVSVAWKVRPQTILSTVSYLNAMLMLAKPFLPRGAKLLLREATTPSAFILQESSHPRFWTWAYRHLYKRADRIICLSDAMLSELVERFGLPRAKLVRIYNPVDAESVRRLAIEARNPYSGEGPHLVTAGRLQRPKGLDVLLDAMPQVMEELPNAKLAVLGEGPLEPELKNQARMLGVAQAVTFLGFQQNPWPYMKHADLFVLPSRFEGLPNALLEALVLGKAVIASDCPGGVREIQASFPNVLLVPPENPAALAEGIIRMCRSPHEAKSSKQATEDPDSFDLQVAIKKYTDALLEIPES